MIDITTLQRSVNRFNTPLDEKYYEGLSRELVEDIHSTIDEIIFVQRLLSPNIKHAYELPKRRRWKDNYRCY